MQVVGFEARIRTADSELARAPAADVYSRRSRGKVRMGVGVRSGTERRGYSALAVDVRQEEPRKRLGLTRLWQ
jgi:hypothetical protein